MEIGIIGLPQSGKTTIFNALTGLDKDTTGYAGRKGANMADVAVPDERVDALSRLFSSKKISYASVKFIDIQMELGEHGEFTSRFIGELRNADALVIVLRGFDNPGVPLYRDKLAPLYNLNEIMGEVLLTDLMTVERRLERLKKEAKLQSDEARILTKIRSTLEQDDPIRGMGLSAEEKKLISGFDFLSEKPIVVVLNRDDSGFPEQNLLETFCNEKKYPFFEMNGKLEAEIAQLDRGEQEEFLTAMGLASPSRNRFIRFIYKTLGYISFLTTGEDETRAWTIQEGVPAVLAAGKIHSDIERGFIRAEVIDYRELLDAAGFANAKKSGTLRLEGKDYIIRDGEIVHFRFNV